MTLAEKIEAAAAQAQRNEAEAYSTLELILSERKWPAWLQSVAADVDGSRVPRDRPINQEVNRV